MADCCQQLKAEIAALKAEIKSIPRINEAEIVKKTEASLIPKLPGIFVPILNKELNPFKRFQAKQVATQKEFLSRILNNEKATKVAGESAKQAGDLIKRAEIKRINDSRAVFQRLLNNEKAGRIAANNAKVAEVKQAVKNKELLNRILKNKSAARAVRRTASEGLQKAGSALSKVTSIGIKVASFGVAVGTLKLVEYRFDQQEKVNTALSRDLSKTIGLIGKNRALIKENATRINENKKLIDKANDSAYSAQKQATKAREIGEGATKKSEENSNNIESNKSRLTNLTKTVETLPPKISKNSADVKQALRTSNQALQKANEANTKANQGLKEAIKARNKAFLNPGNNTTTVNNPKTTNNNTEVTNAQIQQLLRQTSSNGTKLDRLSSLIGTVPPAIKNVEKKVTDLPKSTPFKNAVSSATCKTLNTDSCTSRLREDIKRHDTANGNILLRRLGGKIDTILNAGNAGANALQVSLLNTINKKMGTQLPGGLSGTFGRLWNLLQVDRALNILNFLTSLHNATYLSTNVAQTLFAVIDSAAGLVGLEIKNEKDEKIGVSGFLSNILNDALNKIFGATNVAEFKAKMAAANRIYQTVSNMLDDVQGMFDSGRQLMELTSNNTGIIGNALKKAGVIFEDAFEWMSEKNNAASTKQKKWDNVINGINNIDDKLSNFNSVIEEVKSAQDNITNLKESRENFNKVVSESITTISESAAKTKEQSSAQTDITSQDVEKAENVKESP